MDDPGYNCFFKAERKKNLFEEDSNRWILDCTTLSEITAFRYIIPNDLLFRSISLAIPPEHPGS